MRVLSAGNIIMIFALIGVLALQVRMVRNSLLNITNVVSCRGDKSMQDVLKLACELKPKKERLQKRKRNRLRCLLNTAITI